MNTLYFDLILISICLIALLWCVLDLYKLKREGTPLERALKQLESERRKLLHRFKMFRDKCNGDWKNNFYREQRHHYIDFYNSEDVLFTGTTYNKTFELFGYFKNESDCDKAIELFGDEIKRLYVDCEV